MDTCMKARGKAIIFSMLGLGLAACGGGGGYGGGGGMAPTYSVGGTVTGLNGTLVLQDNGTNNDTITTNGAFTFSTPLAVGMAYSVTVMSKPAAQTCTVTNGSGTVGYANVTNVTVNCV